VSVRVVEAEHPQPVEFELFLELELLKTARSHRTIVVAAAGTAPTR